MRVGTVIGGAGPRPAAGCGAPGPAAGAGGAPPGAVDGGCTGGSDVAPPIDAVPAAGTGVAGGGAAGSSSSVSAGFGLAAGLVADGAAPAGGDGSVDAPEAPPLWSAADFGDGSICGFSCASVSVSRNVTVSPGPGRVSFGASSGGVASSSITGGFTGIRPMIRSGVRS